MTRRDALAQLMRRLWDAAPNPRRTLGAIVVTASCTVALAATAGWLIVRAATRPAILSLAIPMGLVQLFAISRAVSRYGERVLTHDRALRMLGKLRVETFAALAKSIPGPHGRRSDAELQAQVIDDIDAVEHFAVSTIPAIIASGSATLLSIAISCSLLPVAAGILALAVGVVALVAPLIAARWSAHPAAARTHLDRERHELLATLVHSGAELSTSPGLDALTAALDRNSTERRRIDAALARRRGVLSAATSAVSGLSVVAISIIAVHAVQHGHLSRTTVAVIPLLAIACLELVGGLTPVAQRFSSDLEAMARLDGTLELPATWPDGHGRVTDSPVITARALSLSHDASRPLITGCSFSLHRGTRLSVTGPSGSGKSTLCDALLRFVPPTAGTLTLGDAPYGALEGGQVRTVVRALDQEPHCFNATLRANLLLAAPDASDAECLVALERAQLQDLARSGLDTAVGFGGERLSGGERRRLGLARLFLAAPEVIVLDEPTEGLDDETATTVLGEVDQWSGDRPVVLVSHRALDHAWATAIVRFDSAVLAEDQA